jgi:hypothetical protein
MKNNGPTNARKNIQKRLVQGCRRKARLVDMLPMSNQKPDKAEIKKLRATIRRSLREQGFRVEGDAILPPRRLTKNRQRQLHAVAVAHLREQRGKNLARHESDLLEYIANGSEVEPDRIQPRLIRVRPNTDEELLFRYACVHWSIPISSGYGRRLRFLVTDESNGKLIGLFGLCDPVYAIAARDSWIGWDHNAKREHLRNVLEAFVLGSVPPYSSLLCGKLVAMLVASDEVRASYRRTYGGREALISGDRGDGRLVMVTTASALGRSSIYNRVRFRRRTLYEPIGFTSGYGEFQFTNGLYSKIHDFALSHCEAAAGHENWGSRFRNRREVVRKSLAKLGFDRQFLHHGIRRELFAVPLAMNTREFLRGETQRVQWFHQSAAEIVEEFRQRWLLPRAQRDTRWLSFDRETYRLWND